MGAFSAPTDNRVVPESSVEAANDEATDTKVAELGSVSDAMNMLQTGMFSNFCTEYCKPTRQTADATCYCAISWLSPACHHHCSAQITGGLQPPSSRSLQQVPGAMGPMGVPGVPGVGTLGDEDDGEGGEGSQPTPPGHTAFNTDTLHHVHRRRRARRIRREVTCVLR